MPELCVHANMGYGSHTALFGLCTWEQSDAIVCDSGVVVICQVFCIKPQNLWPAGPPFPREGVASAI